MIEIFGADAHSDSDAYTRAGTDTGTVIAIVNRYAGNAYSFVDINFATDQRDE